MNQIPDEILRNYVTDLVTLEDLKNYSEHIDNIKFREGSISITEKLEIYKFYVYAKQLMLNMKPPVAIDAGLYDKEETLLILHYLSEAKERDKRIMSLLSSTDRETAKLGVELLKKTWIIH